MAPVKAGPDVLLIDVDGVLVVGPGFKPVLADRYGIRPEATETFFTTTFVQCQLGRADLRRELARPLGEWGWPHGVNEFMGEWFRVEAHLNPDLLSLLVGLRRSGTRICLTTMQECHRLRYLLHEIGLSDYVDETFATCDIGFAKTDTRYFEEVLRRVDVAVERVLFVDDTYANVTVAASRGLPAVHYCGAGHLEKELHECR